MLKIGEKGRVIIALMLTFGVLAYLVQGDRQGTKPTGVDLPLERPVQQASQADTSGATKVAAPIKDQAAVAGPKAEDILKEASSKAEGGAAFFIEYRLERDRQRSQQIALLKQIIDNPNSGGEGKQEAQKRLVELTQQMDLEMQLEKLIVAKGYKDAAVFIQPNAVNVIVMADKFGDEDANKIGDLVSRSTGRPREQVSMIHKK
ncbi:Stage III sporulation protein AH-like [Moorella glycerini]|uniref:Stage III sporulation protein AH n=1 Tax=Neomoorella stamsii TaxID=1266720 RepID=A0A9X7J242_9FIRM|nr:MULTISPECIES: SpoIIIAH-like family protein [Moorella]PRR71839.1 Stage III sporulation protein AH [Moorella stamsii]CEP66057.1 Stage III sporulation protein AH-like [Moorella glycerini]